MQDATSTLGLRPDVLGPPASAQMVSQGPSGFLSVNAFWEHKKSVSLCKTNCRSIEVPILYPLSSLSASPPFSTFALKIGEEEFVEEEDIIYAQALERPAEQMEDDQEPEISPITSSSRVASLSSSITVQTSTSSFPFLNLPFELRLKIYALLLPPRHHRSVTQLPHNGYFYNTSNIPAHSSQSFYPFGTKPPTRQNGSPRGNLTTYKVLSSNSHRSYPSPSIYPAILGTNRQVKEEAEAVLYGSRESVWDFGVHLDACRAFWADRSPNARALVRGLRVAWEVPVLGERELIDGRWEVFCRFLKEEMRGLRNLDLTIWSSSGSLAGLPVSPLPNDGDEESEEDWERGVEKRRRKELERKWSEWDWVRELLEMEALRTAKITWWGFENLGVSGRNGETAFDSWLARRMTCDNLVRDRMLRDGVVVEGVVVLNGKGI